MLNIIVTGKAAKIGDAVTIGDEPTMTFAVGSDDLLRIEEIIYEYLKSKYNVINTLDSEFRNISYV